MISQENEIHHRLQTRLGIRRFCLYLYVLISVPYLIWRLTIFNPDALVLSALYYLAELLSAGLAFNLFYSSWSFQLKPKEKCLRPFTVDVFIPAYTEPLEMIELTLKAAKELDYPHETYLLDDGKRDDLKALAERVGTHYLRRTNNEGMKAGNLNNGLKHSQGELVAVFDSDHVAQREALDKLITNLMIPS